MWAVSDLVATAMT